MNVEQLIAELEQFPGYREVEIETSGRPGVHRAEPTEVLEEQRAGRVVVVIR